MQSLTLDAGRLALTFSKVAGHLRLTELADAQGDNWVGSDPGPLWRIVLGDGSGGRRVFTADDFESIRVSRTRTGIAVRFASGPVEELSATLRVHLTKGSPLSLWRLKVSPPEGQHVVGADVPLLSGLAIRDRLKLATPTGWGIERSVEPGLDLDLPYPSWAAVMQFVAAYEGGRGLYLAAHDSAAGYKRFQIQASETGWSASIRDIPAVDADKRTYVTPFEAVVGVFEGGAYEAAQLYRPFALAAPWSEAGPVSKRHIPKWVLDTDLWLKPGETPWTDDGDECRRVTMENVEWCRRARDYFQVPISLHWYRWHQIPYDTLYPEYFPAKAGFVEAVKAAQNLGFHVMPYINGRLCDPESATWKDRGGSEWAVRDEDGKPYTEVYGSGVPLHPMCPATPGWQSTIARLVARLAGEIGADGVYIDQIAAAQPYECHASGHRHLPGGGSWWTSAYRDLLKEARGHLSENGMLTSEENAEPWNDLLDALLVVNTPTNEGPLVPLYPAVYSGWVIPFGFQYIPKEEVIESLGFRSKMARAFLWGSQPGWVDAARIMADDAAGSREFLRNLVRCRHHAHNYLLTGRFLGELDVKGDNPRLNSQCPGSFGGTYTLDLPAVMATAWGAEDGRVGVAVCNMDDVEHNVSVTLPPEAIATRTVHTTDPDGHAGEAPVSRGAMKLVMPARGAMIVAV